MNAKTAKNAKQTQPLSRGPSIEDLRAAIERAEGEGIDRADMLLHLTFRDASLIKRSPSVGVDEVRFSDGDMRFVGVKTLVGPVALSSLEAPALPVEPVAEVASPAKKAKVKPKKASLEA